MRIFKCFSSRQSEAENFDKRSSIKNDEGTQRMARKLKTNEVVAADLRYQTHVKLSYFSRCIVTDFLRAGNPCVTLQFI